MGPYEKLVREDKDIVGDAARTERHRKPDREQESDAVEDDRASRSFRAQDGEHARTAGVVQRRASGPSAEHDGVDVAQAGVAGAREGMPHGDTIQAAFGKHDVSGIRAQVGGAATDASAEIGAEAYAIGDRVGFAREPDLHTAAHEAAHVAQQRAGKVHGNGVTGADDAHEGEADQVADAVVAGQSAEPLLDHMAGPATAAPTVEGSADLVQRKTPQDQPSTFVPAFKTNDQRAEMNLGEMYPHKVWVTNSDSAPKGTKYHWTHSVSGPSYRVGSGRDKPSLDGDYTSYPFELRGVGTYEVDSKVKYGVGTKQHESQTGMQVVVDKVTKHDTEMVTEKDGKKRPFAGSMLVGEDLVITTSMNDLRRSGYDAPEAPRAHVAVPGLEFKGVKAITHGIYEIRLHAPHEGGALGNVAVLPFDTKLGDTPIHTVRTDIQKADDASNPDARPVDFAQAKSWLKADYDHLFREMHTGNQALIMQSQVSDPPPKQSLWVDIVLGCVTAAFGGAVAGVSLAVAKSLIKDAASVTAEAIQEGVKSFLEQSIVAAATATFSKADAQNDYPHVAFFKFTESLINKKQLEFEQLEFANKIVPRLDAEEKRHAGAGMSEAMRLDGALKQEAPNVSKKAFDEGFEQWIKFVTKAQFGETGKSDPKDPQSETGTDMGKLQNEDWTGKLPGATGVIHIDLGYSNVFDPKTPVIFGKARMPGINQKLREKIASYKIKDLPFAVRVHGGAPGRYDGSYTFSRNEQGLYWLSKDDHEYLAKKGGGLALDGARKILEQEIGDVQMTPEG